jgi:apolipoprotein N-acyltransferase
MQVYHKSTLFPFGEYLPFAERATARRWLPGAAHLSSGDGASVLELNLGDSRNARLGPSICYEDVFPSHAGTLARLDADILINVSNDSWFGDHGAARWHLMMAAFRSIETRIPQVRATNSGYSAFILPDGSLHEVTSFDESTERSFALPIVDLEPTPFTRFGDWFGWLGVLVTGVAIVARRRLYPEA